MKVFKPLWEVFKVVLAVFAVAIIIRLFVFQPFIVDGSSMEPNFHNNEYVLVEKLSYDFHAPKRGDVVVLKYPGDITVDYIKRVIGLPGETVTIDNGSVYINGKVLDETAYLAPNQKTTIDGNATTQYQVTLGANQYFVMGDNRDHSADSREGWLLDRSLIVGRSSVVLFPVKNLHAVASPTYN